MIETNVLGPAMQNLDDTKTKLLQAAGQIFADKGFEAATVREICRLANVGNIAAVNYYFRDKETLYLETVRHAYASRMSKLPRPDWPPDMAPADKLRRFLQAMMATLLEGPDEPWQRQLIMRELTNPSPGCIEFVRNLARPTFELLLSILDEILPSETPAARRHLLALSIIGQCVYHRMARPIVGMLVGQEEFSTYEAARLADHVASFSLAALGLDRVVPVTKASVEEAP
jgi:AcrR family transcriptional regulator